MSKIFGGVDPGNPAPLKYGPDTDHAYSLMEMSFSGSTGREIQGERDKSGWMENEFTKSIRTTWLIRLDTSESS